MTTNWIKLYDKKITVILKLFKFLKIELFKVYSFKKLIIEIPVKQLLI